MVVNSFLVSDTFLFLFIHISIFPDEKKPHFSGFSLFIYSSMNSFSDIESSLTNSLRISYIK